MNLDEALAVFLYLQDNTQAWVEPGKSLKDEAWAVISSYARHELERRVAAVRPR